MRTDSFASSSSGDSNVPEVMNRFNRCKYFLRRTGCIKGDACEYCHVHPIPKKESAGGLVVDGVRLGKREREEYWQTFNPDDDDAEEEDFKRKYKIMKRAVQEDRRYYANFGKTVHGVHLVVWTINRLQVEAFVTQARVAEVLLGDRGRQGDVGVWLGRDKASTSEGHYSLDEYPENRRPHGVYTLMGGFATRLMALSAKLPEHCEGVIFFEGDADIAQACAGKLLVIKEKVEPYPFVHLGYLTADTQKRYDKARKQFRGDSWSSKWSYPKDGCQMFWIKKSEIAGMVDRLREQPWPTGLDKFFFAPSWFEEYRFLCHSICGQRPGPSDSFGVNNLVGTMEEPDVPIEHMQVRSFSDSDFLRSERKKEWERHGRTERKRRSKQNEVRQYAWLESAEARGTDEE
jgi:hypothetical protein